MPTATMPDKSLIKTEKDLFKEYNIRSYSQLENALKEAKTWEVIKQYFEEQGNIQTLFISIYAGCTYEEYVERCMDWIQNPISEEKYKLIKEMTK